MHSLIFQQAKKLGSKLKQSSPYLFIRELLKNPGSIGAVCPSSQKLAQAMVARIDPQQAGYVIELGPGTGVMTEAILAHGIAPERLIVVEFSENFYDLLHKRFPTLNIILGNAMDLQSLLADEIEINSIVSSLPLMSMPTSVRDAIIEQWRRVLGTNGQAIQFTYNLKSNFWKHEIGAVSYRREIVLANLPPAKVMSFRFSQ